MNEKFLIKILKFSFKVDFPATKTHFLQNLPFRISHQAETQTSVLQTLTFMLSTTTKFTNKIYFRLFPFDLVSLQFSFLYKMENVTKAH
jgi:hypothetical protein